ncbi:MAG TPA: MarR family transcriptional regulator [Caulobacteraceae bacterium]|jgi:DNA-binding MarR family transcriptional regulator|nr:MarR family transcriptional regulator [Caulobacteraceae bacterium]
MTQDPEKYLGLAGFRQALRHFVAASETINRDAGTTQQQYQAMLAIKTWPYETMSMKDLAEQLLLTHHAAVQLVDRLAKSGLATREASQEDRRSVNLALTDKGAGLLDELAGKHLEELLRQEPMLTSSLRRLKRLAP